MNSIAVRTGQREELKNITAEVAQIIADAGLQDGLAVVFCPHTTAGITINEAADPDVARDIVVNLGRLVPRVGDYRHAEGNSDAHIKASLTGSSATVIVEEGKPRLGTWQGIYLAEFDGPRHRKVWVKLIG